MTATLAQIWRHPIKAHGFEALQRSEVKAGQTLPWDRTWAVPHESSKAKGGAWAHCSNFSRGAKAPALMAIGAKLDEAEVALTLTHPDQTEFTFCPDEPTDVARFIDWVQPFMPPDRAASVGIVRTTGQGMTDTDIPSISLGNLSTLDEVSAKVGKALDPRRFRMNFWMDGVEPWDEFNWINRKVQIGGVSFKASAQITRCKSTMANPDTGLRDADTLAALDQGWGHRDFGIALVAETSGAVAVGDTVAVT